MLGRASRRPSAGRSATSSFVSYAGIASHFLRPCCTCRDGTAKLGDLGMARLLSDQYVTGVVGTLAWSSPEMLLGQKCSQRADIFSFGVCL